MYSSSAPMQTSFIYCLGILPGQNLGRLENVLASGQVFGESTLTAVKSKSSPHFLSLTPRPRVEFTVLLACLRKMTLH